MPFITEFRTNMVLKNLYGEIPVNIRDWQPYKKSIYFLNRLDKSNLFYFTEFCKNPKSKIDALYRPIDVVDRQQYVYEGVKPSYHKSEECPLLNSNFKNYIIPEDIKIKGNEAVDEFRKWFKEHEEHFIKYPDQYKLRIKSKYNIDVDHDLVVNYINSGGVYKENLTVKEIEIRIDSLLYNAAEYFKENEDRQKALKRFQTATFLAFQKDKISGNETNFSDDELKKILKEYYYLFIQPTIYYLKEFSKTFFNADIEINEKILEELNFKKCTHCYSNTFKSKSIFSSERESMLSKEFGEYQFPIEPTVFHFKDDNKKNQKVAFIYARVFRVIDEVLQEDDFGKYKRFKIEFLNHKNKFVYKESKIYNNSNDQIHLFGKYLTKITIHKETRNADFITYPYHI